MIRWPLVAVVVLGVVHATTIAAIAVGIPQSFRVDSTLDRRACAGIADQDRRDRCQASLLPHSYSAADMGVPDNGRPPMSAGHTHGAGMSIDQLTGPAGEPQQVVTLTAALGHRVFDGFDLPVMTFNGSTPGPIITATQGDLLEVHLRNTDIAQGVTIHWHGVDVPGREDGVAGVTQDAVLPGEEFVYRFVVPDAGTYWYHTHQDSVLAVSRGLVGALVVLPRESPPPQPDVVALIHTYGPVTTINGQPRSTEVPAPPGSTARIRFINTENGPRLVSASGPFRVAAIDGTDLPDGAELTDTYVEIPAGGRADLVLPVPVGGVRAGVLGGPSLALGPGDATAAAPLRATRRFDPISYGLPGDAERARIALGRVTRTYGFRVGQRRGFLDGRSGNWYTINGGMIPEVPMMMVHRGDVVRLRISNATTTVHPIHLHGHHALVVSRDGVPATGAAWWVDSLDVAPKESYDLVLVADNPGVWMFHCHNLPHARAGLMTHLMYDGISTPYRIGRVRPGLVNRPE